MDVVRWMQEHSPPQRPRCVSTIARADRMRATTKAGTTKCFGTLPSKDWSRSVTMKPRLSGIAEIAGRELYTVE
jgi:hypothetical protein